MSFFKRAIIWLALTYNSFRWRKWNRTDRVVAVTGDEVRKRHNIYTEHYVCAEVRPNEFVYVCLKCERHAGARAKRQGKQPELKLKKFKTLSAMEEHLQTYHGVKEIDPETHAL